MNEIGINEVKPGILNENCKRAERLSEPLPTETPVHMFDFGKLTIWCTPHISRVPNPFLTVVGCKMGCGTHLSSPTKALVWDSSWWPVVQTTLCISSAAGVHTCGGRVHSWDWEGNAVHSTCFYSSNKHPGQQANLQFNVKVNSSWMLSRGWAIRLSVSVWNGACLRLWLCTAALDGGHSENRGGGPIG